MRARSLRRLDLDFNNGTYMFLRTIPKVSIAPNGERNSGGAHTVSITPAILRVLRIFGVRSAIAYRHVHNILVAEDTGGRQRARGHYAPQRFDSVYKIQQERDKENSISGRDEGMRSGTRRVGGHEGMTRLSAMLTPMRERCAGREIDATQGYYEDREGNGHAMAWTSKSRVASVRRESSTARTAQARPLRS